MITRISGVLESVEGLEATVRPEGGVVYAVLVPQYLAERLRGQIGRTVMLHTIHYLESQGQGSAYVPRLIGFLSPQDRRFFDLMTSVEGLGNKRALRVLAQEPALIARAIVGADAAWLSGLPEIGKKTAEKVILELKGKVGSFLSAEEVRGLEEAASGGDAAAEAVAAMVRLGETRTDAERKVRQVLSRRRDLTESDEIVAAAYGG